MINVNMPQNSFATAVIYDSLANGIISGKKAAPRENNAVFASPSGNRIVFSANGTPFEAQILGIDGRLRASLASENGMACSIAQNRLSPGIYVLKAKVQNHCRTSTFILPQ
jgi:hypothetical protein